MAVGLIKCPYCGSTDVYDTSDELEVNNPLPGSSGPIVYKPKEYKGTIPKPTYVLSNNKKYICGNCHKQFDK